MRLLWGFPTTFHLLILDECDEWEKCFVIWTKKYFGIWQFWQIYCTNAMWTKTSRSLGFSLSNVVSKLAQVSGALNALLWGHLCFPNLPPPTLHTTHNAQNFSLIIQTTQEMSALQIYWITRVLFRGANFLAKLGGLSLDAVSGHVESLSGGVP